MSFTKKKLLYLIKENLKEMAMDFDTQDRPDQGLQDKLSQGDTPLKKVPLPNTGDEPNKNFQELLASERYKEVVQRVRQYTGDNTTLSGSQGIMPLAQTMMNAHNQIVRTESQYREQLESLAIELVMKEMGLEEGDVQFDAKIIGVGNGDPSCHEPDKCKDGAWQRSAFNGKCQVIIQSEKTNGTVTLVAKSNGLISASVTFKLK